MRLDCDPTTVYAALLDHRYRGTIYRSDLANTSPWNTFNMRGYRPGRLQTGLSSIKRGWLRPIRTTLLRAKADARRHNFSESLAKHDAAVAQYQRAVRH